MSAPKNVSPVIANNRCSIYIDAFNWYYGIFVNRPEWKWLNIQSYFEAMRVDENGVGNCFFTPILQPYFHISPKRDRQKMLPRRF